MTRTDKADTRNIFYGISANGGLNDTVILECQIKMKKVMLFWIMECILSLNKIINYGRTAYKSSYATFALTFFPK